MFRLRQIHLFSILVCATGLALYLFSSLLTTTSDVAVRVVNAHGLLDMNDKAVNARNISGFESKQLDTTTGSVQTTQKSFNQLRIDNDSKTYNDEYTTKATPEFCRIQHPGYQQRLPKAIGIGVKKCGTTALIRFLALHPDVVIPSKPELHFFDTNDYQRGEEYYRKQMPFTSEHEITFEKSPRYFVLPEVPFRVKKMNSSMKILLVVCDPIKRAYSDFIYEYTRYPRHLKIKRTDPLETTFDDFVERVLSVIKEIKVQVQREDFLRHETYEEFVLRSWSPARYYLTILQTGLYSVYLQNWMRYFPPHQIQVINGEELLTNPVKVLNDSQNFLKIEAKVTEKNLFFNKEKGFYCGKSTTGNGYNCLSEKKGTTRNISLNDNMSNKTLSLLRKYYEPYNKILFDMLGRKFDWT